MGVIGFKGRTHLFPIPFLTLKKTRVPPGWRALKGRNTEHKVTQIYSVMKEFYGSLARKSLLTYNENFTYFCKGLWVAFLFLLVGLPCRLQAEWRNGAARYNYT